MFNKSSKPQNRIDCLIGATTRIEGNVIFSGGLRVDGVVRGNVAAVLLRKGSPLVKVFEYAVRRQRDNHHGNQRQQGSHHCSLHV